MNTLKIDTITLRMPSGINELTQKMFLKFLQASMLDDKDRMRWIMLFEFLKFNPLLTRLRFGWFLLKNYKLIPWADKLTFGKFEWHVKEIDMDELAWIQEAYTDFLIDDKRALVMRVIKRVRIGMHYYSCPAAALTNISWRQYRMAEVAANDFANNKEKGLDKLCASLFLPLGAYQSNYLFRKALSIEAINERAARFSKLNYVTKFAIYVWFCGCRKFIVKNFKEVFSTSKKEEASHIKSVEIQANYEDMLRIRSGAVTKDEATDFSNLYDFLGHFQTEARMAAKTQKLIDEARNKK